MKTLLFTNLGPLSLTFCVNLFKSFISVHLLKYTYNQYYLKEIASITVCPRSLDPSYIDSLYINWVKTSWTDSN